MLTAMMDHCVCVIMFGMLTVMTMVNGMVTVEWLMFINHGAADG